MKHKFFILTLVSILLYAITFGQPVIKQQRVAGGSSEDELTSICLTKDGGFIAGGYSASGKTGEKTQKSRGGDDYWVIKYDKSQHIQWDKTIGGRGQDYLYALLQTTDGGYILGGYSYSDSSGEKTENNKGQPYTMDYWVVKLDSLGSIQWDKTIGGNSHDVLYSLQQTSDGGYILGGY